MERKGNQDLQFELYCANRNSTTLAIILDLLLKTHITTKDVSKVLF